MDTTQFSRANCSPLIVLTVMVLPVVLSGCANNSGGSSGDNAAGRSGQMSTHDGKSQLTNTGSNLPAPGFNQSAGSSNQNQGRKPLIQSLLPVNAKDVQTAAAQLKEIALPLHLKGTIEPDFNKEVDVTSRLSGRVQKVMVNLGDSVSSQQVMAVLESKEVSELEAELVEAQSKLVMAKAHEKREKVIYQEQVERPKTLIDARTAFKEAGARRDLAESEYKRTESLFKEKIAAGKDLSADKAELAHAQAAYEQASANLQREQHLFQNKALLLNDLQMAKAETQRAEGHLDTLMQRLEFLGMTKSGVKRTITTGKLSGELSIVAPVLGIITREDIAAGEQVHPDKPMFTITDLSSVMVRGDLPETHLSRVKLGTGVKIQVAGYPDQTFSGKISFIAEHVEPETHMVPMRVRLENPRRQFKKDMSAEIDLEPQLAKVILCPKNAVFERRGQTHVFVKNSRGSFDERNVIIGAETDGSVEICMGLKEGELVAVDNLDRLRGEPGR